MSDITLVQPIYAQQRREQCAQQKLEQRDWRALLLACLFMVCVIVFMSVAVIVGVIWGLFSQPDTMIAD